MSEAEARLRAFHAARPGVTSRAFARGGSYARLAAQVPAYGRVLDLACGDGHLLAMLGPRAIGVDFAAEELALSDGSVVQARAQALPFAAASFSAATCHLAFMLFDEIEQVVAELARVLAPGAPVLALLGGGPTADGNDAFHAFAGLLPRSPALGDRRASSEAGWRELFASWRDVTFERWPIDLSGTFDEVWQVLGASYQLGDAGAIRRELRGRFPGEHVPCTVATYFARATR